MKYSADEVGSIILDATEIDDRGDIVQKTRILEPAVRAECIQLAILHELKSIRRILEERCDEASPEELDKPVAASDGDDAVAPVAVTDGHVVCPSCKGSKLIFASGIQYAEGTTGPYCGQFPCDRCQGTGEVPEVMLLWIAKGNELKSIRKAQRLTLRDGSRRAGISATEMSAIERGMVDNLSYGEELP